MLNVVAAVAIGLTLALTTPSPRPRAHRSAPATGAWNIKESVSGMDDSRTVVLTHRAESAIRAWPASNVTPALILRCQESQLQAYVHLGVRPAVEHAGQKSTLTLRFDTEDDFTLEGDVSTDGMAVFFPYAVGTIEEIVKRDRLRLRFVPFNSAPQETSFLLTGAAAAVTPLKAACKASFPEVRP